jgi:glutathione S-transferase
MQLIGQYDSPFVRRVGIALTWYGMPFTQLPLSVFGDADALAQHNPLRRVPTLVLNDGTVLTETFVCLDALDQLAAESHGVDGDRLLVPARGAERLRVLRRCGFVSGAADKVVSLVYEERLREHKSQLWTERCTAQVVDTLHLLERETPNSIQGLNVLTHDVIASTCLLTFIINAQPSLLAKVEAPNLFRLRDACEARPEFQAVYAPFSVAMPS